MIHARVNNTTDLAIIGFECGTRADFDHRHGGDSQWIFLDYDIVNYHVNTGDFLLHPTHYQITPAGDLIKKFLLSS
jgi:hypothetical protein